MLSRRTFATVLASATCLGGISAAQAGFLDKAKNALGGLKSLSPDNAADVLSNDDIIAGLREALKIGSEKVVSQVGARDGFNADPEIHIPLPGALRDVQKVLGKFGMADLADDLETRLNRGAEAAAPEAKALFLDAIGEMTLDDAKGILDGPDDAATQYFKGKMTTPLSIRMEPIVDRSLSEVGAIAAYDKMMGQYDTIPLVPDVKADLTSYVVEQGLEGIFFYIAKEEAAIRQDPAKRTTELLQRVFGS